jgi:hypothetical protein
LPNPPLQVSHPFTASTADPAAHSKEIGPMMHVLSYRGETAPVRDIPEAAWNCPEPPALLSKTLSTKGNSLDRTTAEALVDAGYMSMRDYIEMFDETEAAPARTQNSRRQSRPCESQIQPATRRRQRVRQHN